MVKTSKNSIDIKIVQADNAYNQNTEVLKSYKALPSDAYTLDLAPSLRIHPMQ